MASRDSGWAPTFAALDALLALESGWDGYDARPIDESAWNRASQLLVVFQKQLLPQPRVVPVPDGGVQFEWSRGSIEFEIEIDPDGSLLFLYDDPRIPDGIDGEVPGNDDEFRVALQRTFAA